MCPECGEDRGLAPDGSEFRCRACDTTFRRGKGASIVARRPDGSSITRRPADWLDRLPDPETLVPQQVSGDEVIRSARVSMARVVDTDAVRDRAGYLNRIEIWGEEAPGALEIRPGRLVFTPQGGPEESWPLETLTAV